MVYLGLRTSGDFWQFLALLKHLLGNIFSRVLKQIQEEGVVKVVKVRFFGGVS